jgi:PKD domain
MKNIIKSLSFIFLVVAIGAVGCKKTEYAFGELKAPTDLTLSTVVTGVDASNPNGSGVGTITVTATSKNALTYNIDFGDGTTQVVPSGVITYKYANPGTFNYTITVNAIGTGGSISTISKRATVFVAFTIPPPILATLTNGSSRVWITDKAAPGHFGVGQNDLFFPNYYGADPNTREACAYDDEITFSTDPTGKVFMSVNNKGTSFSIGASTAFYGFAGGDGCYAINTGGNKLLAFSDATSASTPANSSRIQFRVPGNGIINFGTGGVTYEIISYGTNTIHLRNIGADGNAWYQKLIVKP